MGPQDFGDEKPGVRPTCPEELLSQGLDIMTDVPRLTFASRRDFHNSEVLKKTFACNGPFYNDATTWMCFCWRLFYGLYYGKSPSFTIIWESMVYFFQAS